MTARRWVGSGVAFTLLVGAWQGISAGVAPAEMPAGAVAARAGGPVLVPQGAGSCSATACHGSITPVASTAYPSRVLRDEHTTWVTQDRHANAYDVLFSERSKSIARNLSGEKLPAHQDARCLACHATPTPEPTAAASAVVQRDGVSCEACHGAAEKWLGAHTQAWWSGLDDSVKESQYGMRTTRPLNRRVGVCVDCHVGAPARNGLPARDVNHDLIAAGHPRLNFEFSAFLANMPPHWVENTRGSFPAQAWAIGQVATAKAAVDLLEARARRAVTFGEHQPASAPWPEFSEYDCFSCHHDLVDEPWRKQHKAPGVVPGTPAWGTWYYPSALALSKANPHGVPTELAASFQSLHAQMGRLSADPGKVAGEARSVSEALARWLQSVPEQSSRLDATTVKSLIDSFDSPEARASVAGWDHAAQRYLALQPLRLSLKDLNPGWADAPLKSELDQLFRKLQFPRGFDSPRRYLPDAPAAGH